ncbi:aminotransferase class IV [Pseudodesulfovibrio indicus]|uniref:aminotransferase class IV n=1 Tax=Pseudodesulfovibrio indicus TaxID=1716143 RepID=UPI002930BD22|nr:aminotransferase class IV [Pseudodesulfovibrio indicus]
MIHYQKGTYSQEGVRLGATSPALLHGAGFGEILYHNGRELCHLDLHLDRLLHALRSYGVPYETVDFHDVVTELLDRNGLRGQPARVDILYPLDSDTASPVVTARPHEPKPYKAYRLCLCEERHLSALAGHRTANGLFHHLARQLARSRGFDDAALFDMEDNLLEATRGALVFEKQGVFACVDSPYRQPSIALDIARRVLDILPLRIPQDELPGFRHAYILNSLIGMRPVVSLGETGFVPDTDTCNRVSEAVLLTPAS